jgi:hypothetical protein
MAIRYPKLKHDSSEASRRLVGYVFRKFTTIADRRKPLMPVLLVSFAVYLLIGIVLIHNHSNNRPSSALSSDSARLEAENGSLTGPVTTGYNPSASGTSTTANYVQFGSATGSGSNTTFSPATIPFSNTEIGNPMRGPEYYNGESPPPNFPLVQYSHRWCWSSIETSQGVYNFSLIDNLAATAQTNGGSFGWRIMPENDFNSTACLPSYLSTVVGGGTNVDFNNPYYLQRVQAMLDALSQRYANDPRIDLLDMSYEGCYGEWNTSCGGADMTAANRQALIDMQFAAFPNKRFLMLTNYQDSLNYALQAQRSKPTGVRIDCLGYAALGGARTDLDNNPLEHNRWTTSPLYFEYCNNPDFQLSQQDIVAYHASLIGDGEGNIQSFSNYSTTDQNLMLLNYKSSGYRFEVNNLTIPATLIPGQSFAVTGQWTNVNYAPAYIPWNVMVQLRDGSGNIAWQGKSSLDLQVPFTAASTGNDAKTVPDTFTLPSTVPSGAYTVSVQILDPNSYYKPLALANTGRLADGSYPLGTINVGAVQACTAIPPGGAGQSTATLTIPSTGTYSLWSRLMVPSSSANSYYLQIDNGCPYQVSDTTSTNTWDWVLPQGSSTTQSLSAGSHTITLIGNQAGVKVDEVLLSQTCTPTGTGDGCFSTAIPTVTLVASPASITSGASSTLTWSSTNATSCSASGGWSGSKATSGSQSVSPTATTTYTLSCTGAGGSGSASAVVTVGAAKTGDINGDGNVDIFDLSILLSHYGTNYAAADLNHDGTVSVLDLSILLSNYGT